MEGGESKKGPVQLSIFRKTRFDGGGEGGAQHHIPKTEPSWGEGGKILSGHKHALS